MASSRGGGGKGVSSIIVEGLQKRMTALEKTAEEIFAKTNEGTDKVDTILAEFYDFKDSHIREQ